MKYFKISFGQSLCQMIHYPKYDPYLSNNIHDMNQNNWTMKYIWVRPKYNSWGQSLCQTDPLSMSKVWYPQYVILPPNSLRDKEKSVNNEI